MSKQKVVGIEGGKKESEPCMFCGADHPHLHCTRPKFLEFFENGQLAMVRFRKPVPPDAEPGT